MKLLWALAAVLILCSCNTTGTPAAPERPLTLPERCANLSLAVTGSMLTSAEKLIAYDLFKSLGCVDLLRQGSSR